MCSPQYIAVATIDLYDSKREHRSLFQTPAMKYDYLANLHGKLDKFHELLELGALVHFKARLLQIEPALVDSLQTTPDGLT